MQAESVVHHLNDLARAGAGVQWATRGFQVSFPRYAGWSSKQLAGLAFAWRLTEAAPH